MKNSKSLNKLLTTITLIPIAFIILYLITTLLWVSQPKKQWSFDILSYVCLCMGCISIAGAVLKIVLERKPTKHGDLNNKLTGWLVFIVNCLSLVGAILCTLSPMLVLIWGFGHTEELFGRWQHHIVLLFLICGISLLTVFVIENYKNNKYLENKPFQKKQILNRFISAIAFSLALIMGFNGLCNLIFNISKTSAELLFDFDAPYYITLAILILMIIVLLVKLFVFAIPTIKWNEFKTKPITALVLQIISVFLTTMIFVAYLICWDLPPEGERYICLWIISFGGMIIPVVVFYSNKLTRNIVQKPNI